MHSALHSETCSSGSGWPLHLRNTNTATKTGFNQNTARPFAVVSKKLEDLGCMSIDTFLSSSFEDHDEIYSAIDRDVMNVPSPPPLPSEHPEPRPGRAVQVIHPAAKMQTIARLHQACQRTFGNTEALSFEFLEENGANSKQCILTITRPNGLTRSYTTQPVFARKNEAKAQAASIAVEMGAIDFIIKGDAELSKHKKGLVLAPLDAPGRTARERDSTSPLVPDDPLIKQIEDCCIEWRAGRIKPHWIALTEPKIGTKQGCALRIELSLHSLRVYSSAIAFDSLSAARTSCANIALDQGVLEYIRHGNGQTAPAAPPTEAEAQVEANKDVAGSSLPSLTLQSFYETLPQPFPESFGDKTAAEINAPAWLNQTIQSARGGRLSTSFIWIADGTLGLHGCLLRLERPEESKSYLVNPRFPKRADAKAAVCLQAISQGVGEYIRAIGEAIEKKISPLMRRWANEQIFPIMGSECRKIGPTSAPKYDFEKDKDAYGCTLTLELSPLPTPEEVKQYTVPIEYRTKVDAKIAVVCLAVQEDAFEFLRFRGQPPPPGYVPLLSMADFEMRKSNKRKEIDGEEKLSESEQKRQKTKGKGCEFPLFETKEEALARRGRTNPSGAQREHRVSGSGGAGSSAGPSSGRPTSQSRPGNRSGGTSVGSRHHRLGSARPLSGGVLIGLGPNQPYASSPEGRSGHGGGQAVHYNFAPPLPPPSGTPFQAGAYPSQGVSTSTSYYGASPTYPPQCTLPPTVQSAQYTPPPFGPSQRPYKSYSWPHHTQPYTYPPPAPVPAVNYYPSSSQTPYAKPAHPTVAPSYGSSSVIYETASYNENPPRQHYASAFVSERTSRAVAMHSKDSRSDTTARLPSPTSTKEQTPHAQITFAGGHGKDHSRANIASSKPSNPTNVSEIPDDTKPAVTIERTLRSHVTELLNYCVEKDLSVPQFHHDKVTNANGPDTYKVWIVLDKERLELPVTFSNLAEGQERVSKQVLSRLRSNTKKGKP